MPISGDIYSQMQAPDIMGNIQQGLKMRDMLDQRNRENQIRQAYQAGMTQNPDGTVTMNKTKTLSNLYPVDPKAAMDAEASFAERDKKKADLQKETSESMINFIGSNLPKVSNQETYTPVLQTFKKLYPSADTSMLTGDYEKDKANLQAIGQAAVKATDQMNDQRKREENANKHEENNTKRAEMAGEKETKLAKDLQDHLDKGWSSRGGNAGKVQNKINAAEYAEGLLEQGKGQKNGLDSRQIEELAQSVSQLLGGGTQASARVEALVPHTMFGRAQTLKEWLTNNPEGQGQEEFVKRMAETVQREKAIANRQKSQFQVEGLPAFVRLKTKNPELYNSILRAKGIDDSMIDENGRFKSGAPRTEAPLSVDPKTVHQMNDQDLDALYKQMGGQ